MASALPPRLDRALFLGLGILGLLLGLVKILPNNYYYYFLKPGALSEILALLIIYLFQTTVTCFINFFFFFQYVPHRTDIFKTMIRTPYGCFYCY